MSDEVKQETKMVPEYMLRASMQAAFREAHEGRVGAERAYDKGWQDGYKRGYIWGAVAVCIGIGIAFGLPELWHLLF